MNRPSEYAGEQHVILPDSVIAGQQQHPLLKGMHVCRVGFFPRFDWFVTERPTGFPDSDILIYCQEGEGWFEAQGERWTIRPGELLVVFANVPHAYGADPQNPWTIQWVHLAGEETAAFFELLEVSPEKPVLAIGRQLDISRYFSEILRLCQLGYGLYFLIQAATLLRQILSRVALNQAVAPAAEQGLDVGQTVQYMLAHLDQSLTVPTLAAQANLSPSHFSRQFHKKIGYPPLDYFIRLKMQKAGELLRTSDLLVQEIGRAVGYEDAFYFSRVFKKIVGVSPREYRRTKRDIV